MGIIYGLRMGPNFVARVAADKNFYMRLVVEKMHTVKAFNDFKLRPYGCSSTNFTATVNYSNRKTDTLTELIKI